MAVADDECLGINDFNAVYQESKHCSANWEEIGSLLGISKHTIAIIKEDNPQRCERCMNEMLTHWLKKKDNHANPSWKSLCQALYSMDRATADQIAEKHHITIYIKPEDITKPILKWIEAISHYQLEVCKLLEHNDGLLVSLANNLFEKGIIDDMTKNEVDRQKGYDGADTMMDYVKMKIKQTPELCQTFLQVMEEFIVLEDVVEHVKNKPEAILMHSEDFDITNVESTAERLQEMFEELLVSTTKAIENVNVKNLRVRINWFFNRTKESELATEDYLMKLEKLKKPEGVLNFLVRTEFIGWLNYELIKVFQKAAKNKKLNNDINQYEQRHIDFLQVKFKDIVQLFRRRPDLAPKFPVGLPKLQIYLDKPWENKSMYEWKEFLQKRVNWPPDLMIKTISKKCIVLTYAVLPFFVPSVVRDLIDPHVLTELESEGVRVHFLFNFGRQDVASQTLTMPMESSEFLSTQHINEEEREKQDVASQTMSIPEKSSEKTKFPSTQHISSDSEEEKEKQDIVSQTMSTPEKRSEIIKVVSTYSDSEEEKDIVSQTMSTPEKRSEITKVVSTYSDSEEEKEKQDIVSQTMSTPEKSSEITKVVSTYSDSEEEIEKQDIVSQTMSTPEKSSEITTFMSDSEEEDEETELVKDELVLKKQQDEEAVKSDDNKTDPLLTTSDTESDFESNYESLLKKKNKVMAIELDNLRSEHQKTIQEIKSTFEKNLDLQMKEKDEEIRNLKEEFQKSSEEAIQEIKSTFEKNVLDLDLQLKEKDEEIRKLKEEVKEELQKSSEEDMKRDYKPGNSRDVLRALSYHNIKHHQALKQDGYTRLKVVKCILAGPPGAGKSTLKKRLLNESLGDDLSTGVVNAAVQVDSFRKLHQQGVIVPNLNEDSNLEWRKQDVDEEAVFLMNTIAESIRNITDSENDETSSTDSENDETSDDLRSVSVDTEDHRKISQNVDISTRVIHKRTEQGELRVKTPPAPVEWMEEAIEDHRSSSNSGEHVDQSQSEIDETIKPMEVRSHLHETLEQDSTTHDDDLKTKAIDEISKAVEKIPTKKKQQYISNIQNIAKDNHAVLQIIDTGGQPEFHEMLPALITGPAIYLLVFKLTEDLQGRYEIIYRSSDGNSDPYLTSLTHEEVIFRSLSSIACLRYNTVGWNFDHDEVPVKDDSEPAAFLIASHRDCVDDDKVDTVNGHLKHRIQSSAELFGEKLIHFCVPGKPVFALDTTRDQNEIEDLRKSLHNVINTKFQDIMVPVSWCALSLKLKRRKQSLYTYRTCFKLAKESGIKDEDDFKAVLWFLHNRAGTIMYYPDVEGLEDIIITNIQLVFDRITELMTSCFTFKNLSPSAEKEFHTMGMFTESDIRELSKRKGDPLTPKRLVALLKYLHIVAGPLKTKVGRSTKISYFMSCALKPADIESEHRNETSTPAPLLIWFECGYIPVGVYCCLVVYLLSLSEYTEFKWRLDNPPHYRNKICFTVNKQCDRVTILSRATYIEVWVDQTPELKAVPLKTLCQHVHSILNQGINAVTKTLHYSYNSRHYFGFPCCSSSSSCLPPHPAMCEDKEPVVARCVLKTCETMVLKDNHSIWFQQVSLSNDETLSSSNIDQSHDSTLTMSLGEDDLHHVCEAVSSCVKWIRLGLELGLKYSRLQEIEIKRPRDIPSCRRDMIAAWLRNSKKDKVMKKGRPTWKQLIQALKNVGEISLSEEIMKRRKVSNPVRSVKEKSRRDLSTDEKRSVKKRKKRIESSFDSHESTNIKKRRLESSDDDERSVASKVQGKGPASGKPYKRKRIPKNKTDSQSEDDDSDSEPSSKRR